MTTSSALGVSPPPDDEEGALEAVEATADEHPLLDFGDACEDSLLPELKSASVQSRTAFGPQAGQPLERLVDPDIGAAFAETGAAWSQPAICLERLEVRADGQIVWYLRKAWRDGTKAFEMSPQQFIGRLAALAVHPREHQLTYQGILAPAAPLEGPGSDREDAGAREAALGGSVACSAECGRELLG